MSDTYVSGFSFGALTALENAISSGAMTVSYEGKSTTFRSLDEMLRIRNIMRKALGLTTDPSTIFVAHNRGFGR